MHCYVAMSNLLEPLLESEGRQVNSCGALCFRTRFAMYSRRDKPSRFLPSPLAGLTRQWHARGGESKRAGLFDLFLANGSLSGGGATARLGQSEPGARADKARSSRVWPTWAGTAIVRRQATCRSVPLSWKNSTLTFSVDYKGNWKSRAIVTNHYKEGIPNSTRIVQGSNL